MKGKKTTSVQEQLSRRGAAAMARATAGRSRTVPNKKAYDRKRGKAVDG